MAKSIARHRRGVVLRLVLVTALVCSLVAALPTTASAAWWRMTEPDVVSQSPEGALGNSYSWAPRITDDGQVVAFTSDAANLFEGDTFGDGERDVFYRDMADPECIPVTADPPEAADPSRGSRDGSISDDGRYIAFYTGTDFVPEDTNGGQDLYVYDTETGEYTKATLGVDGASPGSELWDFRISGDGSCVVFYGNAHVLGLDNPERNDADVYVWYRESDETTLASSMTESTDYRDRGARGASISDDGRYVAIYTGRDLVEEDVDSSQDLYLKDLETGEYQLANLLVENTGNNDFDGINVIGDGSGVVFETSAGLVEADSNGRKDVYLWKAATDELIWVSEPGEDANDVDRGSRTPAVSDDGRYVAFVSGVGFSAEDLNAGQDIYVRDMATGMFSRFIITPDGSAAGDDVEDLDMSGNGEYLAFSWRYAGTNMGPSYVDPSKVGAAVDPGAQYAQVYRLRIVSDVLPGSYRLAGDNRYETAIAVSEDTFPDGATTVVIATGGNWPDALCASALAGAVVGPVLLTGPDELPDSVVEEIERLGAQHAYIVGGTGAVSDDIEEQLNALLPGYVNRLSGANRYATSRAVANRVIDIVGDTYTGHAIVTTGDNYPDALAAAPIASGLDWPILLANPDTDSVYVPMDVMHAAIVGGTGAVSADVEADLVDELGEEMVDRIAGSDRYETSAMVAQYGVDNGLLWNGVGIASGVGFPDALAGGTAVGLRRSVVLLTPPDALSPYAAAKIEDNSTDIKTVHFFGGSAALSNTVVNEVAEIIGWD